MNNTTMLKNEKERNMRICILSMQNVPNMGSLLQGYSLKSMLEQLGCEVSFIDIEKNELDQALVQGKQVAFRNESENLSRKKIYFRMDVYFLNRLRIKWKHKKQCDLFEKFRKEKLCIHPGDNEKQYDLCVIGSDEVFNCMSSTEWGFTSQLFGQVRQSERVITYAASCGATVYEQLTPAMCEVITDSLKKVEGISVRDENTGRFVSFLTDQAYEYHMDPVWVADFDAEIQQTQLTQKLPKRYCVVYSYYNRIHQKEEIGAIRSFCKEKRLALIALGAPQMWISNYVAASPFEALKIIEQADFIITDTFHGTIFSEKYNGKYAVLLRESNGNKLSDLVKRLHIERHLIQDFSELDTVYSIDQDKDASVERQKDDRVVSMAYLHRYVSGTNSQTVNE